MGEEGQGQVSRSFAAMLQRVNAVNQLLHCPCLAACSPSLPPLPLALHPTRNVSIKQTGGPDAPFKLQLLTAKPMVYLVNLSDKDYARKGNKFLEPLAAWVKGRGARGGTAPGDGGTGIAPLRRSPAPGPAQQ